MLLFFSTVLIILLLIILVLLSELCIEIKDFYLLKKDNSQTLKYEIKIRLKFLGKIPMIVITLSSIKPHKILNKSYINNVLKTVTSLAKKQGLIQGKIQFKIIPELLKRIEIKLLKFNMNIDTEDVILTSYLVAVISIIVPNIIRKHVKNLQSGNYSYKISPIYKKQNIIHLKLNSIISIKVVHIISIFKIIGGIKNERSSNRKLNVNCYGEHKKYDRC